MPDPMEPNDRRRRGNGFGRLLAVCGAIVFSTFSVLYLAVATVGILSGCVQSLSKYDIRTYCFEARPGSFLFAIAGHLVIATLFSVLSFHCLVSAGWVRSGTRVEQAIRKVEARIPDPRRPLPTWFVVVVLGCFICFLATIARRGAS